MILLRFIPTIYKFLRIIICIVTGRQEIISSILSNNLYKPELEGTIKKVRL
jgi:hypothetical protein